MCADCHLPGTLCMWTDCTTCFEGCATTAGECGGCLGGAGEAGLPLLLIMGVIVLGLFTVIGIFYSVLVATMVGQRIWQRHYHILAKRMLTKVSTTVNSSASISTMVYSNLIWCSPGICCRGCRWWAHRLVSAATPCRAHQPAEVAGASIIAHTIMSMADDVDLKLGLGSALPSCTGGDTKQELKAFLVSAWKCGNIVLFFFVYCNGKKFCLTKP